MGVIIIEIKNSDDFTKIQTQLKGGLLFWKQVSKKRIIYMLRVIWKYMCGTCAIGVSKEEVKQHKADEI